jgi:hypothetical protein
VRVTGFCYHHIDRRALLWSVDPNERITNSHSPRNVPPFAND